MRSPGGAPGGPRRDHGGAGERERIARFYDEVYHRDATAGGPVPGPMRRLARRLGVAKGTRVLDVACGTGEWLAAASDAGAEASGVDLSSRAVEVCRARIRGGDIRVGPAEELPFADGVFDLVTCLGALEHFLDQRRALAEMVRVCRPDGRLLLLVPNAGFLTRRLGLYRGTEQADVREEVLTIAGWEELLSGAGLRVNDRWRDLHVLSREWIGRAGPAKAPLRLAQALSLCVWPLAWQYQLYFLCTRR